MDEDDEGNFVPTWESRSSRGRVRMALGLAQDKIKPTPQLVTDFFNCLLCNHCASTCPSGVDVPHIIESVRNYLVEEDLAPTGVKKLLEGLDEYRNIFQLDQDERLYWAEMNAEEIVKEKVLKEAELGFFIGCQASFRASLGGIPEAVVQILNSLNIDFTVLGEEEWCCGNPYFLLGMDNEKTKEVALHNIKKMQDLKVKRILTACPGCFRVWTKIYPRIYGKSLPFEILHTTQFFAQLINEGKIKPRKLDKILGYQDPCELGRHCGVYEEPREILRSLADSSFKEIPLNRDDSNCCGGGGLAKAVSEPMTIQIAKRKLQEYSENNAKILVTACPACLQNLATAKRNGKVKIKIKDINQLLAQQLDLS